MSSPCLPPEWPGQCLPSLTANTVEGFSIPCWTLAASGQTRVAASAPIVAVLPTVNGLANHRCAPSQAADMAAERIEVVRPAPQTTGGVVVNLLCSGKHFTCDDGETDSWYIDPVLFVAGLDLPTLLPATRVA